MNGRRLAELREARGWNQAELARRSSLPSGHISQIESGKKPNPNWDTVEKLATAFGLSHDEFVRELKSQPVAA